MAWLCSSENSGLCPKALANAERPKFAGLLVCASNFTCAKTLNVRMKGKIGMLVKKVQASMLAVKPNHDL